MLKVCRRNFKHSRRSADFAAYSRVYQYGLNLDPAEVDYFTLIGNIIITVQYIENVWMINIHTMKRLLTGK